MKVTRSHVVYGLAFALLAAGAIWFAQAIEWVDIDVRTLPKNEAARDRFYAAKSLVRALGGQAIAAHSLDTLPPATATLLLSSSHWNMFPGRDAALRRWVENGGRLVLVDMPNVPGPSIPIWTTLRQVRNAKPAAASASAASAASASAPESVPESTPGSEPESEPESEPQQPVKPRHPAERCVLLTEPDSVRPAFVAARSFRVCGYASAKIRSSATPLWSLEDLDGVRMERVAVGKGSVAVSAMSGAFNNDNFITDDGPLVFVALLDLQRQDDVWFIQDEARAPFFRALWSSGKAALLLSFAALALALWRGMPRFGPLAAEPSLARRSIGEQIRRTSAFIAAGPGDALHRATLNALEATAARTIADFESLSSPGSRAQAIAARNGTDPVALEAAMQPPAKRRALPGAIAEIERARRALLAGPAGTRPRHELHASTP